MKLEPRHAVFAALATGILFLGYRAYQLEVELGELRSSPGATDDAPADSFDQPRPPGQVRSAHQAHAPPTHVMPSASPLPNASARAARRNMSDADIAAYWEAAFAAEPVFLSWFEKGRLFRDNFHAVLPAGGALRSFACRSTLCRTELGVRNIHDYHAVVDAVFAVPGSVMNEELSGYVGGTSQKAPDGSLIVVLFLTRRGRSRLATQ